MNNKKYTWGPDNDQLVIWALSLGVSNVGGRCYVGGIMSGVCKGIGVGGVGVGRRQCWHGSIGGRDWQALVLGGIVCTWDPASFICSHNVWRQCWLWWMWTEE